MSIGTARPLAEAMKSATEFVEKFAPGAEIEGSISRGASEVHDIDLMTKEPLATIKWRLEAAGIPITRDAEKSLYCIYDNFSVNIYIYEDKYAGAMSFYLTGPREYTIAYRTKAVKRGWILNQYGLFNEGKCIAGKTEQEIYQAFDKNWKEPHLRGKK